MTPSPSSFTQNPNKNRDSSVYKFHPSQLQHEKAENRGTESEITNLGEGLRLHGAVSFLFLSSSSSSSSSPSLFCQRNYKIECTLV